MREYNLHSHEFSAAARVNAFEAMSANPKARKLASTNVAADNAVKAVNHVGDNLKSYSRISKRDQILADIGNIPARVTGAPARPIRAAA